MAKGKPLGNTKKSVFLGYNADSPLLFLTFRFKFKTCLPVTITCDIRKRPQYIFKELLVFRGTYRFCGFFTSPKARHR